MNAEEPLVERVARALWDAHDGVITLAWEDATDHYRDGYRKMARAGIDVTLESVNCENRQYHGYFCGTKDDDDE